MKKDLILKILVISAIVVATPFFFFSFAGIFAYITHPRPSKVLIPVALIFGILGYLGLIASLMKDYKDRILTYVFLGAGILGVTIFLVYAGGQRALQWLTSMEEPLAIFMFLYPVLIAIVLLTNKILRLTTKAIKNADS